MNNEVELLIDAKLDGTLSEAQGQQLAGWIAADLQNAIAYTRRVRLHTQLRGAFVRAEDVSHVDLALDELCVELSEGEQASVTRRANSLRGLFDAQSYPSRHPLQFVAASLALTIAFWVIVTTLVWPILRNDQIVGDPPEQKDVVATLVRVVDAGWMEDAEFRPESGEQLREGDALLLESGLLELKLASGTKVALQGPVRLDLLSKNSLNLSNGRLDAFVPRQARGFLVSTPHAELIDLGTEFQVSVARNEATRAHVFQGSVAMTVVDEHGAALQSVVLATGQTATVTRQGKLRQEHQGPLWARSGIAEEPADPGTVRVVASDNASVLKDEPKADQNESQKLVARSDGIAKDSRLIYLRFDLSNVVGPSTNVTGATLDLWFLSTAQKRETWIYALKDATVVPAEATWDGNMTWNSRPDGTGSVPNSSTSGRLTLLRLEERDNGSLVQFKLGDDIAELLANDTNQQITIVMATSKNHQMSFASLNNTQSHPVPTLVLKGTDFLTPGD